MRRLGRDWEMIDLDCVLLLLLLLKSPKIECVYLSKIKILLITQSLRSKNLLTSPPFSLAVFNKPQSSIPVLIHLVL